MAETVQSSVSMPRIIAARQQHRSNISSHLAEQFSSLTITAGSILGIIPSVKHSKEINLSRIVEVYHDDLLLLELEPMRWKSKYSDVLYEKLPSSPSSALKIVMLKCNSVACTIPVTSCECEWSASALRRLHNYMRSHEIINGERTSGHLNCLAAHSLRAANQC